MQQCSAIVVGESLECDTEFTAVAKQELVMMGDSGGPCVEIKFIVEVEHAGLLGVGLCQYVAGPNRPISPSRDGRCFENGAVISKPGHFEGRRHAGNASAEHDD